MSQAQSNHFLQNVFQITVIALVSEIKHYQNDRLHLFWDSLYKKKIIFVPFIVLSF